MKKILIVGDSHVAAMKAAEELVDDFDVELDFLAALGPSRQSFVFDEVGLSIGERPIWKNNNISHNIEQYNNQFNVLVKQFETLAGNKTVLKYVDYTAIVLVGGIFFMRPWEDYVVDSSRYSKGFQKELFTQYKRAHHDTWLKSLYKVSHGLDIYSLTEPLINELALNQPTETVSKELSYNASKVFSDTYDFINYGLSCLGVKYVPLPQQLLNTCQNATKAEFKVSNPKDMTHLNAKGGEIRLRNLLEFLKSQDSIL